MQHKFNKPYYEIHPNMNCAGVIYVNDVPVFDFLGKETHEGIMEVQIPINHVVLESGKYKVVGKLLPRYDHKSLTENDGMSINFSLCDFDYWKDTKHQFSPEINSPESYFDLNNEISSPLNKLPVFEIFTEISVDLPFSLDGWQNSIDLSKIDENVLKQQVFAHYKKVHTTMANYDAASFISYSKEKEALQDQAFYFTEASRKKLHEDIYGLFNEKLEVLPLDYDELRMQVFGNGKLVSLTRPNGSAALQFISPDPDKESNVELEVKLHKRTENKGFTII